MTPRAERVDRVVLGLLGLVLAAAGILGLLVGLGIFGEAMADRPVLPTPVRQFAADNPWLWWLLALIGLLVALAALRWLVLQLRTDRVATVDFQTDPREGRTAVDATTLTTAIADEAAATRGVASARAVLRDRGGLQLDIVVDLAEFADVGEVRARLEEEVVPHARQAIEAPDLPVTIELRPGRGAGRGLQ